MMVSTYYYNRKCIARQSCDRRSTIVRHHRAIVRFFHRYECDCCKTVARRAWDVKHRSNLSCDGKYFELVQNLLRWFYVFVIRCWNIVRWSHGCLPIFLGFFFHFCRVPVAWQGYDKCERGFTVMPHGRRGVSNQQPSMMTSSNGNIFRITGHLCGEFTGRRWIPRTKASDAELWFFFYLRLNKRLSKQSWGWWFETLSCSLWRHCNDRRWWIPITKGQ